MSKHSSKKSKNQKTKSAFSGAKASKPTIFLFGFLFILVGVFGVMYNPATPGQEAVSWEVSEEGMLSFPQRGDPVFAAREIEDVYAGDVYSRDMYGTETAESPRPADSLKLLTFESKGDEIQSLLRIPASSSPVPGIVLLPGAGVSKEKEQGLAVELSRLGYATLTLDQRGSGGVPGAVNPEGDLKLFRAGLEPLEYKMTYDALKAADVLAAQPEIDPERLAVIGESNGGRFAVLACALEPSLKGAIGISTSGYGTGEVDPSQVADPEAYRFYRSIDPDTYLSSLPPARLVLIHSFDDTVIPHELAARSFGLAEEPKAMYNVSGKAHGYTVSMHPYLEEELALILEAKGTSPV